MEDRREGGGGSSPSSVSDANISPRRCPNPIRFLLFDSERGDKPVSLATPHHVALTKTIAQLMRRTAKSHLTEIEHLQSTWWKRFPPLPKNLFSAAS